MPDTNTHPSIEDKLALAEAYAIRAGLQAAPPPPPPPKKVPNPNDPAHVFIGDFIDYYADDPVAFAEEMIGKPLFEWQKELLTHVTNGERYITVRAGHGVGKTFVLCVAAVWMLVCKYPQKTIVTAPAKATLLTGFLPEIKSMILGLPKPIRDMLLVKNEEIALAADPNGSFFEARTASKDSPEALSGIHSANVLLIVDEASGVPEQVYKNAAGSMSGENACTVLIGNPTRSSGYFYNTHTQWAKRNERDTDGWLTMHVNCEDVALVDQKFISKIIRDWGIDSAEYKIRVRGEFANDDNNTLIPAYLVDDAMQSETAYDPTADLIIGVDVARFGTDRTVLCFRRGDYVEDITTYRGLDTMAVVGIVASEAKMRNATEIMVDSIGVGGGVGDRLREMGYNCWDVSVSDVSAMRPEANRLRDELWLHVKEWLQKKVCKLPADNIMLREELVSPTYNYNSNGKIVVEGKDSLRKRISRSCDLADALCLTFAGRGARIGGRGSKWTPGKPLRRNIPRLA